MGSEHGTKIKVYLTQSQRALLEKKSFSMRWTLIESLRDLKLGLISECPCQSEMTEREIMAAMNKNARSSVFYCRNCGALRKSDILRCRNGLRCRLPFYGTMKTLDMLTDKLPLQKKLVESDPALYYSVIINFGSVRNAMLQLGIQQGLPKEEVLEWQEKTREFFGRISDIVIAECAGVSINSARRNIGSTRYNHKKYTRNVLEGSKRVSY